MFSFTLCEQLNVCIHYRHQDGIWEDGKTGRWRKHYALGNILLGNLGLDIHVNVTLTCTTYLSNVADQIRPFMATVFYKVKFPLLAG